MTIRTWLIVLVLACCTLAQESQRKVRFYAYPSDTKVYCLVPGPMTNQMPAGNKGLLVGVANGEPVNIKVDSDYGFKFRLEHPNFTYRDYDTWTQASLDQGVKKQGEKRTISEHYPWDQSPIRGDANSVVIGFLYSVKEHPAFFVPFFILAGGLAVGGGLAWNRARKNAAYERKRELLIAQADLSDPLINTTLDRYLIVQKLGQGGMATVYKGVPKDSLDTKEQVAIKVVKKEFADNEEFRDRFKREVQVSKKLSHPNIVRVDDWGDQDGLLYMVLEYVDGKTMDDLIPRGGWSLEEGLPNLLPIINGLIVAHDNNIVHRDLKPENIMVTKSGVPKIMDFGLARTNRVSSKLTKTGSAMGTPAYISPEQIRGITPRPAMDQYSLGIMMYEMFTGRLPFDAEGLEPLMMAHFTETPPTPLEWKSSMNPVLAELILRMLEKTPELRFESLKVVKEGLEHIQSRGTWELPPKPEAQKAAPAKPKREPAQSAVASNEGTMAFQAPATQKVEDNEGTMAFQAPATQKVEDNEGTMAFQAPAAQEAEDKEGTLAFQAPKSQQIEDNESTQAFQSQKVDN